MGALQLMSCCRPWLSNDNNNKVEVKSISIGQTMSRNNFSSHLTLPNLCLVVDSKKH